MSDLIYHFRTDGGDGWRVIACGSRSWLAATTTAPAKVTCWNCRRTKVYWERAGKAPDPVPTPFAPARPPRWDEPYATGVETI